MTAPFFRWIALATLAALAPSAQAHASLETPEALPGAYYSAVLRIGHGCQGSATHTVSVRLPEGLQGAKPMPKAGWELNVRKEPLKTPYDSHGRTVTEDTVEVTWKARSREAWLADAHFDEFTVRGRLPQAPGPLWFKVKQLCETGSWDWSEIPSAGTDTKGLKAPAVLLQVKPAANPANAVTHRH
jgi:periplasmic copper chaperone A